MATGFFGSVRSLTVVFSIPDPFCLCKYGIFHTIALNGCALIICAVTFSKVSQGLAQRLNVLTNDVEKRAIYNTEPSS